MDKQMKAIVVKLQAMIDKCDERIEQYQEIDTYASIEKAEALEAKRDACQQALDELEGAMD